MRWPQIPSNDAISNAKTHDLRGKIGQHLAELFSDFHGQTRLNG